VNIKGEELLGSAEGLEVLIRDLSGANGSNPIEVVRGFTSLAHANAFARRRVRDSVEICRAPGMSPEQVRDAWFAFGEDAEVQGAAEGAWTSASELAAFVATRCRDSEERNWRVLDPRNDMEDDEAEDDA
jgi:hypothetical protein